MIWSLDARVLVRPARTFAFIAANPPSGPAWRVACGRPLLFAFAIGCVVSLGATGTLTARIAGPATVYWMFVPLVEIAALAAVARRRPAHVPFAAAIDAYFTGHAAWTLLLIGLIAAIAVSPPSAWWMLLTRFGLAGMLIVMMWSGYTNYCFYRVVLGSTRAAALRALALSRLITWVVVFAVFALPLMTPWEFAREIAAAIREVL